MHNLGCGRQHKPITQAQHSETLFVSGCLDKFLELVIRISLPVRMSSYVFLLFCEDGLIPYLRNFWDYMKNVIITKQWESWRYKSCSSNGDGVE
jgi:hypothetical protein